MKYSRSRNPYAYLINHLILLLKPSIAALDIPLNVQNITMPSTLSLIVFAIVLNSGILVSSASLLLFHFFKAPSNALIPLAITNMNDCIWGQIPYYSQVLWIWLTFPYVNFINANSFNMSCLDTGIFLVPMSVTTFYYLQVGKETLFGENKNLPI